MEGGCTVAILGHHQGAAAAVHHDTAFHRYVPILLRGFDAQIEREYSEQEFPTTE